jgi:hypothetical protein
MYINSFLFPVIFSDCQVFYKVAIFQNQWSFIFVEKREEIDICEYHLGAAVL